MKELRLFLASTVHQHGINNQLFITDMVISDKCTKYKKLQDKNGQTSVDEWSVKNILINIPVDMGINCRLKIVFY